jgi:nitrous oxidase accessory protein
MRSNRARPLNEIRRWFLAIVVLGPVVALSPSSARLAARSLDCPNGGQRVEPGSSLQAVIDAAVDGTTLCLAPGRYVGPIVIRRPIALQGSRDAAIASTTGSTIRIVAPHVSISGVTIDGSGDRLDTTDAAVYVGADDVSVRKVTIVHALFGLVAERASDVAFAGNHVIGDPAVPDGLRGDGIHLWEVRHATVTDNVLEDVRDMVVWYSPGSVLRGNMVRGSRYGTHFMYAIGATATGNHFDRNVVGVFVMYSHDITLEDNDITNNTAVDGMGIGVKDSGPVAIRRNRLIRDRACLYIDHSPFADTDHLDVRGNLFAACDAGVTFHASETRTTFADNRFEGNQTAVTVEGRGSARDVVWHGNYFDDYRGYDADGDGIGDVPYTLRDASERLIARRPALALFRGTPAMAFINAAADAFPVLEPETLLVDDAPRMRPAPDGR